MQEFEKTIIRKFSLGDSSLRAAATFIYRTEVIRGHTEGPEMEFMAEIDTEMYDFPARARARERLHNLIAQERKSEASVRDP